MPTPNIPFEDYARILSAVDSVGPMNVMDALAAGGTTPTGTMCSVHRLFLLRTRRDYHEQYVGKDDLAMPTAKRLADDWTVLAWAVHTYGVELVRDMADGRYENVAVHEQDLVGPLDGRPHTEPPSATLEALLDEIGERADRNASNDDHIEDLQGLARACWDVMTDTQRASVSARLTVRDN